VAPVRLGALVVPAVIAAAVHRCPRCGELKPLDAAHFYFRRTGLKRGQITGYCKPCNRAWHRGYGFSPAQHEIHRRQKRAWWRRSRPVPPPPPTGPPPGVAALDERTVALLAQTTTVPAESDDRPVYDAPGTLRWDERVCAATDCWERVPLPFAPAARRFCSPACSWRERWRRWKDRHGVPRRARRRAAILAVVAERRAAA